MPIYEYICPKCGQFEVLQSSREKITCKPDCTDPDCPKKAKKIMSAGGFIFNGTGFYSTDYKNKSKEKKD